MISTTGKHQVVPLGRVDSIPKSSEVNTVLALYRGLERARQEQHAGQSAQLIRRCVPAQQAELFCRAAHTDSLQRGEVAVVLWVGGSRNVGGAGGCRGLTRHQPAIPGPHPCRNNLADPSASILARYAVNILYLYTPSLLYKYIQYGSASVLYVLYKGKVRHQPVQNEVGVAQTVQHSTHTVPYRTKVRDPVRVRGNIDACNAEAQPSHRERGQVRQVRRQTTTHDAFSGTQPLIP